MELFLGLSIATIYTLYINYIQKKRIEDYQYFAEKRVEDFKSAFNKGYETQNGVSAFREEVVIEDEPRVYASEENEYLNESIEEHYKPERWDD